MSTETCGLSGLSSIVELRASLQASIPSLCGIQVYKDLTSMVTRIEDGRLFIKVTGNALKFEILF